MKTTVLSIVIDVEEVDEAYLMSDYGLSNFECYTEQGLIQQLVIGEEECKSLCAKECKAQHSELYSDHDSLWEAYWSMRKMWTCQPGDAGNSYPSSEYNNAKGKELRGKAYDIIAKHGAWKVWEIQSFYWDLFDKFR